MQAPEPRALCWTYAQPKMGNEELPNFTANFRHVTHNYNRCHAFCVCSHTLITTTTVESPTPVLWPIRNVSQAWHKGSLDSKLQGHAKNWEIRFSVSLSFYIAVPWKVTVNSHLKLIQYSIYNMEYRFLTDTRKAWTRLVCMIYFYLSD